MGGTKRFTASGSRGCSGRGPSAAIEAASSAAPSSENDVDQPRQERGEDNKEDLTARAQSFEIGSHGSQHRDTGFASKHVQACPDGQGSQQAGKGAQKGHVGRGSIEIVSGRWYSPDLRKATSPAPRGVPGYRACAMPGGADPTVREALKVYFDDALRRMLSLRGWQYAIAARRLFRPMP